MEYEEAELSLADYLGIFRRNRWLIGAVFATVVALAVAYSTLTPATYEARAAVLIRTQTNQQLFPAVGNSQAAAFIRDPKAEGEYTESTAFLALARAAVPAGTTVESSYDSSSANRFDQSNQLEFIARSNNPADAQAAANVYAELYVSSRQEFALTEIQTTIDVTQQAVADLEAEQAEILRPLEPIDQALLDESDSDAIGRLTTQRLILQQSLADALQPVQVQLRTLNTDLSSLRISAGFLERDGISARISTIADVGQKSGPLLGRNLVLGAVVGAILALGAALLKENLQVTIRNIGDLERVSSGIPVLSELPPMAKHVHRDEPALALATPYAESLERLVTAVGLITIGQTTTRILITSAMPAEGKSTVTAHLAIRLGLAHVPTAAIDADLRRPNLHNVLEVRNDGAGLTDLLLGDAAFEDAVQRLHGNAHVNVLLAGPHTDQAATLIRSAQAGAIIDKMATDHTVVLIDSPPVLPVTDSQALAASAVDHVLLVVRAGQSNRHEVAEALRRLAAAGRPATGFVLTESKDSASNSYKYSYSSES